MYSGNRPPLNVLVKILVIFICLNYRDGQTLKITKLRKIDMNEMRFIVRVSGHNKKNLSNLIFQLNFQSVSSIQLMNQ